MDKLENYLELDFNSTFAIYLFEHDYSLKNKLSLLITNLKLGWISFNNSLLKYKGLFDNIIDVVAILKNIFFKKKINVNIQCFFLYIISTR